MFEYLDLFMKVIPDVKKVVEDVQAKDIPSALDHSADAMKIVAAWLRKKIAEDLPSMRSIREEFDDYAGGLKKFVALEGMTAAPMMGGGFLKRMADRRLLRVVKDEVRKELKTNGFKSVAEHPMLLASGITLPTKKLKDSDIDAMWAKAESLEELSDELILEYAHHPEVGAFGDGRIIQIIQNAIQWVIDHQEQILKVIQFIIMILAMFGI